MELKVKLPRKLGKLLEIALKDFDTISKDPRYKIRMDVWHFRRNSICEVCLAGTVMANTYKVNIKEHVAPIDLPCYEQLLALDCLRFGDVNLALCRVRYTNILPKTVWERYMRFQRYRNRIGRNADISYGRPTWRQDMEELKNDLLKFDL